MTDAAEQNVGRERPKRVATLVHRCRLIGFAPRRQLNGWAAPFSRTAS